MIDYEALGKYTASKEQLTDLIIKRNEILSMLSALMESISFSRNDFVFDFNNVHAQEILTQVIPVCEDIRKLVNEINDLAGKCSKPIVTIKMPPLK